MISTSHKNNKTMGKSENNKTVCHLGHLGMADSLTVLRFSLSIFECSKARTEPKSFPVSPKITADSE